MKKVFYLFALVGGLFVVKPSTAVAQIYISISIGSSAMNIMNAPVWGPWGYESVKYYYMPEYDMYYDVWRGEYVWREGNRWISRKKVSNKFHQMDLFRTYKVVLNNDRPWEGTI